MDTTLPVTALTALACAVLFMALTVRTIYLRRTLGVAFGDGGHRSLTKAIRGQANAAEQMPLFLILLGLSELNGAPLLAPAALLFVTGRALHAAYFIKDGVHWRWRFYGMLATLTAQGAAPLLLAYALLRAG